MCPGKLRPTLRTYSNPLLVHTIRMREDIQTGHVKTHVPSARKPTIRMCGDLTIRVMGDPRSEDQLPSIREKKKDTHTNYKYPQTPMYTLAEIILIKAFIHILLKTDLSIGVRSAGTPSKHPYRSSLFCRKSPKNFLEACCDVPHRLGMRMCLYV
jgi:hypothetical protein